MTVTHYQSSKGPKEIASLPPPYLANAIAKLDRDGYGPERAEEVAAMRARLAALNAMPDDATRIAATTPAPAGAGHNGPPEPTPSEPPAAAQAAAADPFEALRVHIEDLYTEAKNWADGQEIASDAQAAEVDRLIDDVKDAIKAAETARDEEIVPLNERIKAVRERYYPLIGETKKVTGTAIRAKTALLAVKTKWGDKLRAAQQAEAARLRAEALAQAREAVEATKAAPDNLEVAESAEDLIRAAQGNLREAKAVEKAAPKGFRTVWVTEIADRKRAVLTMMSRHPQEFLDLTLTLAKQEVGMGTRSLEGFTITQTKVAA